MSSIKEPAFFSVSINRRKPIENQDEYRKLFSNANSNQPIGEASTRYFVDPKSAQMIKNVVPNAKIIILLRDPVERAFSSYLYYMRREEYQPFIEIMKRSIETKLSKDYLLFLVIQGGMYYQHVKRYIDAFGIESVKIIFFEEFVNNTEYYFKEILKFLNSKSNVPKIINTKFNNYKKPKNSFSKFILSFDDFIWKMGLKSTLSFLPDRKNLENKFLESSQKPKISQKEKEELINHYKEDVSKLKILLKRDFPWKNFE